jgi:hypothetical protein
MSAPCGYVLVPLWGGADFTFPHPTSCVRDFNCRKVKKLFSAKRFDWGLKGELL